jgi:hypothetical protein
MKRYIKEIDGKSVIKNSRQIVINKDGMNIFNPNEKMILADGWAEYTTPVYEPTIEDYRIDKKTEIERYDSSEDVNIFYINDIPVWLDKATRAGLKLRFEAESAMGDNETTLWYKNMQFQLSIEQAIRMLYVIEKYASACYDNTQKHLAAIDLLEDINAIQAYNYREGYPDKLAF